MLNVSTAFKQKLYNDERNFINRCVITLEDGTVLNVNNEHIMGSGGLEIEDAVSDDESFSALGATVINAATIVLYNNDEIYSDYDFTNAKVVIYTALNVDTEISGEPTTIPEELKKGTFTVDEATYGNATITLSVLDYMEQFDRPYTESQLTYPATLEAIVLDLCTVCGVPLANSSLNFPHKTFEITERPNDESTTCRDVLSYVATVAGCFARCNVDGQLELKWFDTATLETVSNDLDGGTFNPWTTGNDVSGGTFNPWTTGTSVDAGTFTTRRIPHYITSLWQQDIGVDDVVITGVRTIIEVESDEEEEETQAAQQPQSQSQYLIEETENEKIYRVGTEGYVIDLDVVPFFTEDNVDEILTWLGGLLIGLRFRKCNVVHQSDPSIEAGDIGFVWDTKGVEHPILITRVTFAPDAGQEVVCGASTPTRNSATRYSEITKSYVESRKKMKDRVKSAYNAAMATLQEAIANARGMYETQVVDSGSGAVITYMHDKPQLNDSTAVIMISEVGITVTPNYKKTPEPDWYGLQVDGTLIASILNTIGINFDWGTGGTLTLGGDADVNGLLKVLDASGNEIGRWSKDGISMLKGLIQGPTIKVGGNNNENGTLLVYDSSGTQIGKWDKDGADITGELTLRKVINNKTFLATVGTVILYYGATQVTRGGFSVNANDTNKRGELILSPSSAATVGDDGSQTNIMHSERNLRIQQSYHAGQSDMQWCSIDFLTGSQIRFSFTNTSDGASTVRMTVTPSGGSLSGIWNLPPRIRGAVEDTTTNSANVYMGSSNSNYVARVTSSSKRYKHDITDVDEELNPEALYKLPVRSYTYNDEYLSSKDKNYRKRMIGFIAEEVDKIYPKACQYDDQDRPEMWNQAIMIPAMLSLIQDQKKEIDELKERVTKLETLLNVNK